jgi:hypothetical protein
LALGKPAFTARKNARIQVAQIRTSPRSQPVAGGPTASARTHGRQPASCTAAPHPLPAIFTPAVTAPRVVAGRPPRLRLAAPD